VYGTLWLPCSRCLAGGGELAAGLLTPPVLAHAALLAELARLVPGADVDQLAFTARLATTEPEAAGALAASLSGIVEGGCHADRCPAPDPAVTSWCHTDDPARNHGPGPRFGPPRRPA
jgi:hypothetical protein